MAVTFFSWSGKKFDLNSFVQTQERARQLLLPRFQDERAPGQHRPTVPGVNLLSLLAHCLTGVGERWSYSPSVSDYSSTSAPGSRFLKRTLTWNRAFKNLKLDTDFILSLVWFWTFLSFHIHMCGFLTYSQKKYCVPVQLDFHLHSFVAYCICFPHRPKPVLSVTMFFANDKLWKKNCLHVSFCAYACSGLRQISYHVVHQANII